MNAGDTLLINKPGTSYDSHLWIVLSDPSLGEETVIVNFTSWRADKDQACIVDKGDHPYIAHKTCVNFRDAKLCKTSSLEELVANGGVSNHDSLSQGLLDKIRKAVPNSRMNWNCVNVLVAQGLVEL